MTRRLFRAGRAPSVDAYIHRATLGLPHQERLDAAAELRTHLLERAAEFQHQGFSREEAEYLAVRAMGDPGTTNRDLLGHFLTTPLGWVVVAALVAGWVGWQVWGTAGQTRVRWSGPVDVNSFSNGGSLPTLYAGYDFKTPPGTRFVEVAWLGTLGRQRARLPALPGTSGQVFYSSPTWREWWKTRTPLPYADEPWASTCREQEPVHVQLTVQSGPRERQGLRVPNSNLNGVLWCSGLPIPPSQKGATAYSGGSGTSHGSRVSGGVVELHQLDGQTDLGRLRLNHWTLLALQRQAAEATYKTGRDVKATGEAIFVIRPSDTDQPVPLPEFRYNEAGDRWTVREVAP
ncbi:hypothetical protein Dcar01_01957 [Deinococcus carri]|uniref:Uncharacterized protein n=1 Tax=Deinococcus carri TaxID=1211323 RepID=A0ABP9W8C3_9DEIO